MALNRDFIGRTWIAPQIYEVSKEKLREYAVAIGDPHPAYLDQEAAVGLGYRDIVAPPTFATTLWFRMGTWPLSDPQIGKNADPVCLLGGETTTHHRPIFLGDRLDFRTTVHDIRTIGRHELLEMEHHITAEDGQSVCTIMDRMISRGTAVRKEG